MDARMKIYQTLEEKRLETNQRIFVLTTAFTSPIEEGKRTMKILNTENE